MKGGLIAITTKIFVVGVGIAKNDQWERLVDSGGIEHNCALKFKDSKGGFAIISARIRAVF